MSSPSENSPETSIVVSSPHAADSTVEDTASSTRRFGSPPGVSVQYVSMPPNATFESGRRTVRARSASPRPRRTISPSSLSVARQRVRAAEQKAETAISGVEDVASRIEHARRVAEEAIASSRTVQADVTARLSDVASRSIASVSGVVSEVEGKIREMAAQTEAQTSRVVADSQVKMREFVEGHRRDLEAKLMQNQAEARQTAQDARKAFDDLSARLGNVATQLTQMNAAQGTEVATGREQMSQEFGARLQLQSQRIDSVSDSIQQMRQEAADNTKLLHDMIVNMENLGESVKNMQSEFMNWGTAENEMEVENEEDKLHEELQANLLQEVSASFPHIPNTVIMDTPDFATPSSIPIPVPTASIQSGPSLPPDADQQKQKRLEDL